MVDASRIKSYWNRLISVTHTFDGILIAAGIVALLVGILVDIFVLRLLCLLVVAGASTLLYGSWGMAGGSAGDSESPFRSQGQNDEMKKLLFDDFQSKAPGAFDAKESEERESVFEPITVAPPAAPDDGNKVLHNFKIIKPEAKPAPRQFEVGDFFDIDSDIYKTDAEPRTEFDFLLNKVLALIKDVVFAHSVVFFWANREKNQLVVEARLTDGNNFMTTRRIPMGHDLVSRVAETGKPELVTEVNAVSEPELMPYYDSPVSLRSFVGVPVFFSANAAEISADQPVAVIAVDSKVEGAFGEETLALLGQFTKLISALIKNYTDKYDLLLDSEVLASSRRLQERLRNEFSLPAILQSLPEEASRLVSWDFLSVVLYDDKKHAWTVKKLMNRAYEPYIAPEQPIEFPGSIVGNTIKNNLHYMVDDLAVITIPRYQRGENAELRGSFLSLPICSISKCFGALVVESRKPGNFARREVEILARLTEPAALALELLYLNDVVREYVIVDDKTGVYSRKFFLQRMDEELQRADDAGVELSMLQITVDEPHELRKRYGDEGLDVVMVTLAKAIRSSIRSYDIVGRMENNRFGIMLVDTAANEAYLWAEKIRKNVAGHIISHEGKNFSVTISVGVAGVLDGMKKEELLTSTAAVLGKACESGGNTVRVF